MGYKEISCSTACNRINSSRLPFKWDLNIYRGCGHGCKYCYAIYSHRYLESENYFDDIYVKTNIVEQLEKQLKSKSWKREVVNIGGVTDSYQPVESKYKLMPDILKLMIKYRTPIIISTKSDLILRDFDLIAELASITYVNIASTITSMNEDIRKLIEPNGVESINRFKMLKEFKKTNASVGLHTMPTIPYITDDYENIDSLLYNASDCKVDYILSGVMYLRGKTRYVFFDFIKRELPQLYNKLQYLYRAGGVDKEYKDKFYLMYNSLKEKHNLSTAYIKPMRERLNQKEELLTPAIDSKQMELPWD